MTSPVVSLGWCLVPLVLHPSRSVRLSAWVGCGGTREQVLAGVQGDDGPHQVVLDDELVSLADYLHDVRPPTVSLLPLPHDPLLGSFAPSAAQAGEAVLLHDATGPRALAPRLLGDPPGSVGVTWASVPVPGWQRAVRAELKNDTSVPMLNDAMGSLVRLIGRHYTPDKDTVGLVVAVAWLHSQVKACNDAVLDTARLPAALGPRRADVLRAALAVRRQAALVASSLNDVLVDLADQRDAALRDASRACRHAIMSATLLRPGSPTG